MPEQEWSTAVGEVAEGAIRVRGYDLADLITGSTFPEVLFLTLRGELPSPAQTRVLDAALCSIVEHGFYAPTPLAARMVASASRDSVIPGLAAGLLTIGSITVSPQHTAELIEAVSTRVRAGSSAGSAVEAVVDEYVSAKRRMPGLGHPLHPEGDPRASALQQIAEENGLWRESAGYFMAARDEYLARTGRKLPVNIDGMLGCVLSEIGFTALEMPGIAAISFMPGMIAHCVEEITGRPTLRIADGTYTGPEPRHLARSGASS
jgi:citrate synthase